MEVLKMLLDHPSLKLTKDWLTPLAIKSAARGSFESLKLLLERGGFPMEDKNGTNKAELLSEDQKQLIIDATPIAAEHGDLKSLKLLLSYEFPDEDNGNNPPFDIPEDWHKPFIYGLYNAVIRNQPEKFEFLNSFGLQEYESMSLDKLPEGQTIKIQRLLEKAVESGSMDCAKLMIEEYGADPNRHRIPPGLSTLGVEATQQALRLLGCYKPEIAR
jgi:hypothetical protein